MKRLKLTALALAVAILFMFGAVLAGGLHTKAADTATEVSAEQGETQEVAAVDNSTTTAKSIGAAIALGLVASCGAISMGIAISKSADAIARQPEADGSIRTLLMLGLVFIETAIIYALIIGILIIFVL